MESLIQCLVCFQKSRPEWVLNWPGQLVIAGSQTYWTAEVSEALEKKDLNSYYQKQLSQVTSGVHAEALTCGMELIALFFCLSFH